MKKRGVMNGFFFLPAISGSEWPLKWPLFSLWELNGGGCEGSPSVCYQPGSWAQQCKVSGTPT